MDSAQHHCGSPRFDTGNPLAEVNIRRAFWLTTAMMVIEITGGWWFNSMAVLADGWHMSSHSLALSMPRLIPERVAAPERSSTAATQADRAPR